MVEEPNRIPIKNLNVPKESHSYSEMHRQSETGTYRETHTYTEKGPLDPTPEVRRSEARKRSKMRSHLMAATVVVAAVVVLGVVPNPVYDTMFEPVFGPLNAGDSGDVGEDGELIALSGTFVSLDVTDSTVRYAVSVEGLQGGESLTVSLENKFTDRSRSFSGESFTAIERELRPGMEYTLTLRSGSEVLDTATVTTEREHEAHFYLVDARCTCPIDGMFHLTVDVLDDEGVWTHLRVELADRYGGVSEITITDYAAEQEIPVTSAGLRGDSAELRIYAVAEDGGVDLLYRGDHMI